MTLGSSNEIISTAKQYEEGRKSNTFIVPKTNKEVFNIGGYRATMAFTNQSNTSPIEIPNNMLDLYDNASTEVDNNLGSITYEDKKFSGTAGGSDVTITKGSPSKNEKLAGKLLHNYYNAKKKLGQKIK